ncbi:MAG: hypothetical protein ACK5HR_04295 [Mycoplasmatales bacterium]
MLINVRNRNIINLIINNPQTLEEISNKINVSTRTVRRDFIVINQILKEYDYQIFKDDKQYVIIDKANKLQKILERDSQLDFNNIEKELIYLVSLTNGKNIINLNNLAIELYISTDKLKEEVRQILLKYRLKFNYKKNNFIINISPQDKINLFCKVILKYFTNFKLEEIIIKEDIKQLSLSKMLKVLNSYFIVTDFKKIFNTIQEGFNISQIYINDQELFNLTIKLAIIMQQKEEIIKIKQEDNLISYKISDYIISNLQIVDKALITYMTNEISALIIEFEVEKIDYQRINDIQKLVSEFFKNFSFTNIKTQDLEYKILLHDRRVKSEQNNLHYKSTEDLTIIEELIQKNSKIYNVLQKINHQLKLYTVEELKYVFIYFVMEVENILLANRYNILVICSGGVGSSLMIKNQLERFLPNSNIQNTSLAKALNMDYQMMDLVISLTKLPNDLEDVVVNHVITSKDFAKIKEKLITKQTKSVQEHNPAEFFMNKVDDSTLDSVSSLKKCLTKLQQDEQIVDAEYLYQKLKKRESLGIGIPEANIAFYHTRSSSVKQGVIEIIKCQEFEVVGLDMQEQTCNIILLLLLPVVVEEEVTEKINLLSYELITNHNLIKSIKQFKLEEIKEIIN